MRNTGRTSSHPHHPCQNGRSSWRSSKTPLVYLLLAATGISLIAWFIEKANAAPGAEGGEILPFDAIVIVLILIVNAVLGYIQESKAEEAVEALSQMTAPQTNVLRDGKIARINTVDVVPGDMVVLGEGDSIPADGRLLAAASLRVAEASLTGESVPVGKTSTHLPKPRPWVIAPIWCSTARP